MFVDTTSPSIGDCPIEKRIILAIQETSLVPYMVYNQHPVNVCGNTNMQKFLTVGNPVE